VEYLFNNRFCNDERGRVKAEHNDYTVGDIAKELGKRWGEVDESTKGKYEQMAEKDKARYERVRISFVDNKLRLIFYYIDVFVGNDCIQEKEVNGRRRWFTWR
jgi:HMG (high mobility group) box